MSDASEPVEAMSRGPRAFPSAGAWMRAAGAPFAWLGLALLLASGLALALQLALGLGPDAGAWNPTWSFAEVQLPGVDAPEARALVDRARPGLPGLPGRPGLELEWREDEHGTWIVLVGPPRWQELLSTLRGTVQALGHEPTQVGFGGNLARLTERVTTDPQAAVEAAEALLPLSLFGGGLVFLVLGAVLRRRLRRGAPPLPRRSMARRIPSGLALGLLLALGAEGLSAVWALFFDPVVEQPWVSGVLQRGGWELCAVLPMIVLVAPLAEEVFFRGYLLEALERPWGRIGSLVLSSAAFAAVHGHGPALPVYCLYGLGLGLAARRAGTLVVPITAHVTINALAVARLLWGLHG